MAEIQRSAEQIAAEFPAAVCKVVVESKHGTPPVPVQCPCSAATDRLCAAEADSPRSTMALYTLGDLMFSTALHGRLQARSTHLAPRSSSAPHTCAQEIAIVRCNAAASTAQLHRSFQARCDRPSFRSRIMRLARWRTLRAFFGVRACACLCVCARDQLLQLRMNVALKVDTSTGSAVRRCGGSTRCRRPSASRSWSASCACLPRLAR